MSQQHQNRTTRDASRGLIQALREMGQQPRSGVIVELDQAKRAELARRLSAISYDPLGETPYIDAVRQAFQQSLPKAWLQSIVEQARRPLPPTFITIKNAPATSVPPDVSVKQDCLSENLVVGMAALIGEPYAIKLEGNGVANDVRPAPDCAEQHSSQGFRAPLELHTEHPALKHAVEGCNMAPTGIVLTGVRDDIKHRPATTMADAVAALCALSQRDLEALTQPSFRFQPSQRWANHDADAHSHRGPVLFVNEDGQPEIAAAFFPGGMTPETEAGRVALANLGQALDRTSVPLTMTPGTLVYIDNRLTLHGRGPITDGY